jgi:hypothetical protein
MNSIKKFKVNFKNLSSRERAIFKKLIRAAELTAGLYLKQKNKKYPGANFYAPDASLEEIKKAARGNPSILNPYTFVERTKLGKLKAVPYHIKLKEELKPISKLLEDAADLSKDKNFSLYLRSRAKSLLDGSYEKSETIWLKTEPFKFGFVIGPIERYLDKLFFAKCAYQSWVGILDEGETKKAKELKDIILTGRRKILDKSEKVDISKIGIRIDKTAIFSGLIADFMFTGTNLPNDVKLMRKYGSKLTIFETSLKEKFNQDHFPIFQAVFDKKFQKRYSQKELYEGSLRCIISHELAHSLIRYRDAEKRLKNLFPIFDELYAYILGIQRCGLAFLKGVLSQKDLEAILIMHTCRNFTWWLDLLRNVDVYHYATGAAIALNFFLQEKAIKIKGGVSWPNFTKLFICIEELCKILDYYLAAGKYEEAEIFTKKYGSFRTFHKYFLPKLKKFLKN